MGGRKRSDMFVMFAFGYRIGGYGGIGRRAGFRFQWETVQVQILLSAVKEVLKIGTSFILCDISCCID